LTSSSPLFRPIGETVVPLELDPDEVTTPFTLVVLWLPVSVLTTGAGITGIVVVVVVVASVGMIIAAITLPKAATGLDNAAGQDK
jgi:hypothetical protein